MFAPNGYRFNIIDDYTADAISLLDERRHIRCHFEAKEMHEHIEDI
jgi:hypothetical protein